MIHCRQDISKRILFSRFVKDVTLEQIRYSTIMLCLCIWSLSEHNANTVYVDNVPNPLSRSSELFCDLQTVIELSDAEMWDLRFASIADDVAICTRHC